MKKIKAAFSPIKNFFIKKRGFLICFENDIEEFKICFSGNWFELDKKIRELERDNYKNIEFYIY